ncbi:hypothetical protein [Bremerella sp. P1]|uniref:hypothetical protein n=1 Tax=Bremerella sp. P1 TaxID=3026424 RepID=UPI002367DF49|nr:hypothetical protein [Bremerella sp. P1]WDI40853.1 hypothetical protein PSR63_20505 [Bremerella sp. P1]
MDDDIPLIPELKWLAETAVPDDSWAGPGPMLVNLHPWMERLHASSHRHLVIATHAAARTALVHWENMLAASPEESLEAILDGQPPTSQLAAVECWLQQPTEEHKNNAFETVDHTKQLYWFHEEYEEVWFKHPGMWAVESSEFCVSSLTGDPYSSASQATLATISVSCAINSFRTSPDDDVLEAASIVFEAIRAALEAAA